MQHLSLFLFFCPEDAQGRATIPSVARAFLYLKIMFNHSSALLSQEPKNLTFLKLLEDMVQC